MNTFLLKKDDVTVRPVPADAINMIIFICPSESPGQAGSPRRQ